MCGRWSGRVSGVHRGCYALSLDEAWAEVDARVMPTPSVAGVVSRLGPHVGALVRAVLNSPGATTPAVRRQARDGMTAEEVFGPYLAKVRKHAYRVVDADVEALTTAGLGDDAIFEVTVAAALGEAEQRLDAGLSLLRR